MGCRRGCSSDTRTMCSRLCGHFRPFIISSAVGNGDVNICFMNVSMSECLNV
jgi:hypothetical protein